MRNRLHNSVLPQKLYGIYDGAHEIGEVVADSATEAFNIGREEFGMRCNSAIIKGTTSREPMFERGRK